ncbi:MAG: BolA family transcriptional regulator [Pseudomonadaceae bacterium]|nr:BolA family transcriptional regulator [Pseudomonadaceae bacterium]
MSMREQLQTTLQALQPEHLEVLDESHMHSRGLETHYKVVLVTPLFAGLGAVKRHQRVYACLGELMGQVHALALHTYTPDEWLAQGAAPASPTCSGASKRA